MIPLLPQTISRWSNGKPEYHTGVTPVPFGQDRAIEIWKQRRVCNEVQPVMTDEEIAYVNAILKTCPGNWSWSDVFYEILNGRITQ